MEKKYNFDEENTPNLNEPITEYGIDAEMEILPPLTEEEERECMTSDEFWGDILEYVDELFRKK